MKAKIVSGFSRMSREEKLAWVKARHRLSDESMDLLGSHLHADQEQQKVYTDISENHISNYILPFSLAPNFLVNGVLYTLPMVVEESSVVAAAAHAAKFWAMQGGFSCEVKDSLKVGQVHFLWKGPEQALHNAFEKIRPHLLQTVAKLSTSMLSRGGGIASMELLPTGDEQNGLFQLYLTFRTADAMGANYINSVLEALASSFETSMEAYASAGHFEILMAILSNYTPQCLVSCSVEAPVAAFEALFPGQSAIDFTRRFTTAVDIARQDPSRAVTHNKGIFNGMDAVLVATGNDYRAVEAGAHAYASRDGQYRSLSEAFTDGTRFLLKLEVPLALGTVGGLTGLHPLARTALEILGKPGADQLMMLTAAAGLASNFSAIRALVTSGIQQGHMKMHLGNILKLLQASEEEEQKSKDYFRNQTISHARVKSYLEKLRGEEGK